MTVIKLCKQLLKKQIYLKFERRYDIIFIFG